MLDIVDPGICLRRCCFYPWAGGPIWCKYVNCTSCIVSDISWVSYVFFFPLQDLCIPNIVDFGLVGSRNAISEEEGGCIVLLGMKTLGMASPGPIQTLAGLPTLIIAFASQPVGKAFHTDNQVVVNWCLIADPNIWAGSSLQVSNISYTDPELRKLPPKACQPKSAALICHLYHFMGTWGPAC